MAKVISSYETMFIVDVTAGDEAVNTTVAKFKSLIEANGTIDKFEEWGKRKFAYPINDLTEGYYVLVNYHAATEFAEELNRVFTISEDIMRYLTIKL